MEVKIVRRTCGHGQTRGTRANPRSPGLTRVSSGLRGPSLSHREIHTMRGPNKAHPRSPGGSRSRSNPEDPGSPGLTRAHPRSRSRSGHGHSHGQNRGTRAHPRSPGLTRAHPGSPGCIRVSSGLRGPSLSHREIHTTRGPNVIGITVK